MEKITNKLLSYQVQHTQNIVRIIKDMTACLDASDTGTGKTYCAIAACKILNLSPIIICPKSVISTWKKVSEYFDVKPEKIINYESLRTGNNYDKMEKIVDKETNKTSYKFQETPNTIFIFDEVHRCSNLDTENSAILFAAKRTTTPILILSATIADFPEKFKPFFYILNFIDKENSANISDTKYMRIVDTWIFGDKKPMIRIHNMLYPKRASRMRIDVLAS